MAIQTNSIVENATANHKKCNHLASWWGANLNILVVFMLLISTGTETMSKLLYMDRLVYGQNISGDPSHPTFPYIPLFIKILSLCLFIGIFAVFNSCGTDSSIKNERNNCYDDRPWYRNPTIWFFSIIGSVALILGLTCDAMPLGDEGTHFLTWNKNKPVGYDELTNGEPLFSYSLTISLSPNYDVHYQWNETSDVYDVNVDMNNRVVNLSRVDVFLTKYECGVGERMPTLFGSIPRGCPLHIVTINCLHNN